MSNRVTVPHTMHTSVTRVERQQNTNSGNPVYRLTFANGVILRTKPNAGFVYGIVFDRLTRMGLLEIDIVADKIVDIRPATYPSN